MTENRGQESFRVVLFSANRRRETERQGRESFIKNIVGDGFYGD